MDGGVGEGLLLLFGETADALRRSQAQMGNPDYSLPSASKLAYLARVDRNVLVFQFPKRMTLRLFLVSVAMVGGTVFAFYFKWWTVFVFWTLCGLLGLMGLVGIAFAIHGIWLHWRLVLDTQHKKGSCRSESLLSSTDQEFTFDEIQSVNVGNDGDKEGAGELWFVAIDLHPQPSIGLGSTTKREEALDYAGRLARILGTGVTQNQLGAIG